MWLFEDSCVICDAAANGICSSCVDQLVTAEPPRLLDISSVTALFSYEGVGAQLLQALKFKNRRAVLGTLVDALCESLPTDVDAIVAVPGHPVRVRERGVDLPAVMARRISRRLDIPTAEPLLRIDDGSQTTRDRSERLSIEFRAVRSAPHRMLLVDDVVTTGATAVACADALRLAGSASVSFAALAATPAPKFTHQGAVS
jgi:ComF family protein